MKNESIRPLDLRTIDDYYEAIEIGGTYSLSFRTSHDLIVEVKRAAARQNRNMKAFCQRAIAEAAYEELNNIGKYKGE